MRRFMLIALATIPAIFLSTQNSLAMCAQDLGKDSGGYQRIHNSCGYAISFRWVDQGRCSGNSGCLEWLGPNTTHIVVGMQGHVRAGECQGYCYPRF